MGHSNQCMLIVYREQQQFARENPIQAAAAGKTVNDENLLDIDFDAGPATAAAAPPSADLDFFGGSTPSPAPQATGTPTGTSSAMNDLFDIMGSGPQSAPLQSTSTSNGNDILASFGGLDLSTPSPQPSQQAQQPKRPTNDDILGLF